MKAMSSLPTVIRNLKDSCPHCIRQVIASLGSKQLDHREDSRSESSKMPAKGPTALQSQGTCAPEREQVSHLCPRTIFALACDPGTPAAVLARLAMDEDQSVVERVAENSSADRYILATLAWHPAKEVRMAVAENINTPYNALVMLAQDTCPDVRFRLAERYNISFELLEFLADDENPYVRWRARTTLGRLNGKQQADLAYAV